MQTSFCPKPTQKARPDLQLCCMTKTVLTRSKITILLYVAVSAICEAIAVDTARQSKIQFLNAFNQNCFIM